MNFKILKNDAKFAGDRIAIPVEVENQSDLYFMDHFARAIFLYNEAVKANNDFHKENQMPLCLLYTDKKTIILRISRKTEKKELKSIIEIQKEILKKIIARASNIYSDSQTEISQTVEKRKNEKASAMELIEHLKRLDI